MQPRLKRILIIVSTVIASPLILYLSALGLTFILNLGRYVGTFIRAIYSLSLCI